MIKSILVDSREPGFVEFNVRKAHPLVPVEVGCLAAGDIWLLADDMFIVIERKTIPDLLGSIRDGRLENQLAEALKLTPHVILAIAGPLESDADGMVQYHTTDPYPAVHVTQFSLRSVWGMLTKVQRMGAVIRMYDDDISQIIQSIWRIYEKPLAIKPRAGADVQDEHVRFLAALPGIGPKKAQIIWDTHGNLASALAFLTTPDDKTWPPISGIGTKTRENINQFIGAMLLPVNKFNEENM